MKQLAEQRWNPRKHVETEVILHFSERGVVRAKTCDISYGGMRLEVRPLMLYPNTRVRVTFIVRQAAEVVHRSIEALVIYMNRYGCGLMFHGFDRSTFKFLSAYVEQQPAAG
ncbi:MAG: PilZ domain-containing protein [Sulfuricaulis sp.]